MTIKKIYEKYSIPINLQQHMYRVAAVAKTITDNLDQSIHVQKDHIIEACLLHDLGNIIKFDLSNPKLLDPIDQKRVNELIQIREHFLKYHGSNPDEATLKILQEIKVKPEIILLVKESHWETVHLLKDSDWDKKIVSYADMRVAPHGTQSLKDRFEDLMKRREESRQRLELLYISAEKMESEIQTITNINLQTITHKQVEKIYPQLITSYIETL